MRMDLRPRVDELFVIDVPAKTTRPVSGRECSRLVEEEQLGEPARLHEPPAMPPSELELAGDPPPDAVRTADVPLRVVHVPAIRVHEAPRRDGDRLPQRCHPIAQ